MHIKESAYKSVVMPVLEYDANTLSLEYDANTLSVTEWKHIKCGQHDPTSEMAFIRTAKTRYQTGFVITELCRNLENKPFP